jgi:hypothetical protein
MRTGSGLSRQYTGVQDANGPRSILLYATLHSVSVRHGCGTRTAMPVDRRPHCEARSPYSKAWLNRNTFEHTTSEGRVPGAPMPVAVLPAAACGYRQLALVPRCTRVKQ